MRTIRLRIMLRDVVPAVMRVIDVPSSATLAELHEVLQAAMGWTDSHLHQFDTGTASYGIPDTEAEFDVADERGMRVRDMPAEFEYLYDFGDGWHHDVTVVGAGDAVPGCRYGEGACPPEDCGGSVGYEHLVAVLADPRDPEYADMHAWAGELTAFDQDATDVLVRQTVGAVPTGVALVLDLARDGVTLTPGGRLPRVFVRLVQQKRPGWAWSERVASIEEDLVPLAALHDVLRHVGLLRLAKGVLRPTRAAADETEVVRRLRSWFDTDPGAGFTRLLTGLSVAALASGGPREPAALAHAVLPLLGDRWSHDGRPLSEDDVRMEMSRRLTVWRALDLVDTDMRVWAAGSSARTLLPLATALTHLWKAENAHAPV